MVAFASNSLLCRIALRETAIDAATFTLVRIVSGAVCLGVLVRLRTAGWTKTGSWSSALALFAYAAFFSFAYLQLTAGTGALLLFGAVQATMILWAFRNGERLRPRQWTGFVIAIVGLIVLVSPGLSAPPLSAALLMVAAGIAWGVYSLRGKGAGDPLRATAGNFLRAVPMALLLSLITFPGARFDGAGMVYAIFSGAVASGLGYAVWYTALPALRSTAAATVQLSVPVLAALGGIIFLGEAVTLRLGLASIAVLGGIALVVRERRAT
ncbi:MAG TPA: DMT family transporter [Chthoniobacterales bacterium]|nr:DMT family transporter [Chthoniobacterales bacterium]